MSFAVEGDYANLFFVLFFPQLAHSIHSLYFAGRVLKKYVFTWSLYQVHVNYVISGIFGFVVWNAVIRKRAESGRKVNASKFFVVYMLSRYLRTLPVMMGAILAVLAFPLLGPSNGGPVFSETLSNITENCFRYGWRDFAGITSFNNGATNVSIIMSFAN